METWASPLDRSPVREFLPVRRVGDLPKFGAIHTHL
jgi:hypothetical protein